MSKVLFVRGFKDKLHGKLEDVARKEGVTAASILEEALEKWLKEKDETPVRHYLVLYSDAESLTTFLRKIQDLTKDEWSQICCGPESHDGRRFLKKQGWLDVTVPPYVQGIKNPEKYSAKVFDRLSQESAYNKTCFVGFMTDDVASRYSLEKANDVERIFNKKMSSGVTFCPYNMNNITSSTMVDLLELIEEHDEVFILKKNEIFELNISKTNHSKLFL